VVNLTEIPAVPIIYAFSEPPHSAAFDANRAILAAIIYAAFAGK
jgi:hypothetical protein